MKIRETLHQNFTVYVQIFINGEVLPKELVNKKAKLLQDIRERNPIF